MVFEYVQYFCFEANHNKDYSVVNTFTVVPPLAGLLFLYESRRMEEVIFSVEESPEGGFLAKGLGVSIFTETESIEELREMVKDAVHCHFADQERWLNDNDLYYPSKSKIKLLIY